MIPGRSSDRIGPSDGDRMQRGVVSRWWSLTGRARKSGLGCWVGMGWDEMRAQDRQNHAEMQKEKVERSAAVVAVAVAVSCACVFYSSRGDGDGQTGEAIDMYAVSLETLGCNGCTGSMRITQGQAVRGTKRKRHRMRATNRQEIAGQRIYANSATPAVLRPRRPPSN
ncbi:hypothetical protein N431DRAFT_149969 [Stipitochalara longipes BDJ]|nr:hypothetical protein N431DRAFT_149969 [Stipitochalara longipes BDJ]